MGPQDVLRSELVGIILGSAFLFAGMTALLIASVGKHRDVLVFVWLGTWSAAYGAGLLLGQHTVVAALPESLRAAVPLAMAIFRYGVLVIGLLAWSELTVGRVRTFTRVMLVPSAAVAIAGVAWFLATGSSERLVPYNNFLAAIASVVLAVVVMLPRLAGRFMVTSSPVLGVGSSAFAIDALYRNAAGALSRPTPGLPWMDQVVFAGFLLSFAYVAARKVFAGQRRLLAIENELEIARGIQGSILPETTSQVEGLRIVPLYAPMAAVGGDFYDFIAVDANRIGFLMADVVGHGVPAALIASMIKIGLQSVAPYAADPAAVLAGLNRVLCAPLRGMLVSAAYLWVDTAAGQALYSAAGHPPLLLWHDGALRRITSNGLLFGVFSDCVYPVTEIPLTHGDRLLLCTDGVLEPENAQGVPFGDLRLEEVVREHGMRAAEELPAGLLAEIRRWQPPDTEQKDDITLLVIEVTQPVRVVGS